MASSAGIFGDQAKNHSREARWSSSRNDDWKHPSNADGHNTLDVTLHYG